MNNEPPTRTSPDAGGANTPLPSADRIGRYTLLRLLGEGGMGSVYLAEQKTPVERRVALKVIKVGMDTREVVARFEAERQALAVMDHPGIARVFDGGATDSGRPFFAMEFVEGEPITRFCDRNGLSIRERVALFIDICRAVQHAHQKGIVHRDLKPSNILVTLQDGRPSSKIIDFGIAKAIEKRLTDQTFATGFGQFVGTPAYMSPEQLGLTAQDVDTRADIYSLGVLLYELLAGVRPFESREIETGLKLIDAIQNEEPARPSARLTEIAADTQKGIAGSRKTDTATLRRVLERDLDWITLKAIEKDRARRYDTANTLAADLQRYLNNEPVGARPPSRSYRMRKFVARHRFGVSAAAAMLALVIASAGVILVQSVRVARERDRAATEAAKAVSINEFLQQMLASANPTGTGSRTVTVVDALSAAERRLDGTLGTQPEVAAAVRRTLAGTYQGLGEFDRAEKILNEAVNAARTSHRREDLVADLAQLADLHRDRHQRDEALRVGREALDLARTSGAAPEQIAEIQFIIAETLREAGDADAALPLATEVLDTRRRIFGADSYPVASSYQQLANIATAKGDLARAQELRQQTVDLMRTIRGPQHYTTTQALNDLATSYLALNEFEKALDALEEVTSAQRATLGDTHPALATTVENLANVLFRLNRHSEAAAKLEEVLAIRRKAFGDDSMPVARTMFNLGQVYTSTKDLDRAEKTLPDAVVRLERALGAKHPDMITAYRGLATLREAQDRWPEGLALFQKSLALSVETSGPDSATTATSHYRLARRLTARKLYTDAEPHLLRARDIMMKTLGADAKPTQDAIAELAKVHEALGKPEKATRAGPPSSKRMPDGKEWTTENMNLAAEPSYCYDNSEQNCARYGRLYTWESAQLACRALGNGWRLPTNEEWRQLGMQYGGIRQEAADLGKAAYTALITDGRSGFNAIFGGGRDPDGRQYARLDAHGFYWSASESGPGTAWFYNFGKNGQSFGRHSDGEKQRAFSVRCVRD